MTIQALISLSLYAVIGAAPEPGQPGTPEPVATAGTPAAGAEGPMPAPNAAITPARDVESKQPRRGPGLGMTISGFSMFGVSYVGSALVGAMAYDLGDDASARRYGLRMLIPVGGPFAAASQSQSLSIAILTGAAGVVQVAGLGLGVTGAVLLGRERAQRARLAFGAMPTLGGARFSATLRF